MPNLSKPQLSFSKSSWLKIVLIASLILSLISGYYLNNYIKIDKIDIKPSRLDFVSTNWLLNQNLLILDTDKTIAKILADNPKIETVRLIKQYPNHLLIRLTKSLPILQIKTNGNYLIISARGKIISQQTQPQGRLLQVNYYQKIRNFESQPGTTLINQDLLTAARIVSRASDYNQRIGQLTINKPGQIRVQLDNNGPLIIFSSKKNIAKSWGIVHNIIKSLKIKGESPKEINLLFEKPFFVL